MINITKSTEFWYSAGALGEEGRMGLGVVGQSEGIA